MDQPQVFDRKALHVEGGLGINEIWEWEHAGLLPKVDLSLDSGSPHEVGLVGRPSPVLRHRDIIVRAANLVLGAVAAELESVRNCQGGRKAMGVDTYH